MKVRFPKYPANIKGSWFGEYAHRWPDAALPMAYAMACVEVVSQNSKKARSTYKDILKAWVKPETNGPSAFAYSLALGYKFLGGSVAVRRALESKVLLSAADALRNSQELGGHPIGERTLFVLIRLANGTAYEDVLQGEEENEVLILYGDKRYASGKERRQAMDRAKRRVRRGKNILSDIGINVKRLSPEAKAFRKLLQAAEENYMISSGQPGLLKFSSQINQAPGFPQG